MASSNRRSAYVAISDPTRREILDLLHHEGSLMAGEIAARFRHASRPGISRHLRVLKECGVVSAERAGKTRTYSLRPEPLLEIRDGWLASFSKGQIDSLARLRARAESDKPKRSR